MEARPARGASSPPFLFRRLFAGPQRRLRWPTPFLPRSQFSRRRFLPAPKRCGLLHPLRAFWIRLCGFYLSHLTAEIFIHVISVHTRVTRQSTHRSRGFTVF